MEYKDRFVQLVVQEKGYNDGDFRAFYYFEVFDGKEWVRDEIRGYGQTIKMAVEDALNHYTEFVNEQVPGL